MRAALVDILQKTAELGADVSPTAYLRRLGEEVKEAEHEAQVGDDERLRREVGDVLLTAAILATALGEDAEALLAKAVYKVRGRLEHMGGDISRLDEAKRLYP